MSKILQVMGLAAIVAVPICFASPAHADDFYRSNRQSNHWNAFPVGRVIINFPSQQRTTESTRIIQFDRFGSRDNRFFGQQYNNGYSEHNRFGGDRYDNDRYNNNWHNNDRYDNNRHNNDRYDNNRNVQVIRRYDDRYSDHGLSLQIQPKDRPFFSIGNQVGTTEIRRFPIVNRQSPYSSFPFQQINRW